MTRDELRLLIREVIAETTDDIRREASEPADEAKSDHRMTVLDGILTEKHLRTAMQEKAVVVEVGSSVMITPLARDAARQRGIRIRRID